MIIIGMAKRRPQKSKKRVGQLAQERGVYAIRRPLSEQSKELMVPVYDKLSPYLEGGRARLFTADTLGITVIGASRFNYKHFSEGPPTDEVLDGVESTKQAVTARIGSVAIFGMGNNSNKLGFCLESQDVYDENYALKESYRGAGFPLYVPRYEREGFVPHLSIATLYADQIPQFDNHDMLDRLDSLLAVQGEEIILDPVSRH